MKKSAFLPVYSLVSVMMIAGWASACSSVETKAPPSEQKSCDALRLAAQARVTDAVQAHQACSMDSDCIAVGFGANCFDNCTSSAIINAADVDAYHATQDSVDATECANFVDQGCVLIRPPCAPPPAPLPITCTAGVCSGG